MSTDVIETPEQLSPGNSLVVAHTDVPNVLAEQMQLANMLSQASGVIPRHLERKPASILAIMLAARALDLPLYQATQHLIPIEGRMGMTADMQRAICMRHGCIIRVVESDRSHAVVTIQRPDQPGVVHRAEYTLDDAIWAGYCRRNPKAGQNKADGSPEPELMGKDNWVKNTKAMLVARATTTGLRQNCSDMLMGFIYTPGEIVNGADEDGDGRLITVTGAETWDGAERVVLPASIASTWAEQIAAAETPEKLRALWATAEKDKIGYAFVDEELRISDLVKARRLELEQDASQGSGTTQGEAGANNIPPDVDEPVDAEVVEDAPTTTVAAKLACGCPTDVVFNTGNHLPECEKSKGAQA